ncbi:MAG: DoxX family protein [Pseudomonadota bacterium]
MNISHPNNAVFHIGRIGLASLFILGGLNKLVDPSQTVVDMAGIGVPWPSGIVFAVVAVELGLGLLLAAGGWLRQGRFIPLSALLLTIHAAVINVTVHPFWLMERPEAQIELSLFFKNVSIMGGLVMLAALYLPSAKR